MTENNASYPTSAVILWIEGNVDIMNRLTATLKTYGREYAAKWLKALWPTSKNNMTEDLLDWAMSQVDWTEVVKHFAD